MARRKLLSGLGVLWLCVLLYAFLHPSIPGNYQLSSFQPHSHASEMEHERAPQDDSDGGIYKAERRVALPLLVVSLLFALTKRPILVPPVSIRTAVDVYLIRRIQLLLPLKFTSTFVDARAGLVHHF
ncbi:hypothetical protein [Cohnella nanjingensis]|nr:hypothetical protein [Cohnella nanjingensis]